MHPIGPHRPSYGFEITDLGVQGVTARTGSGPGAADATGMEEKDPQPGPRDPQQAGKVLDGEAGTAGDVPPAVRDPDLG